MDIMYQIVNNIEQRDYIRMYPLWYKELNRNPERYQEFVNEIETIKKQSQPTRLQKFEKQLNFAQFMLKMINNKYIFRKFQQHIWDEDKGSKVYKKRLIFN